MKKIGVAFSLWLMLNPGSAYAGADQKILCKMYFVAIHWLHNLFPTSEDLAQCVKDPAGWRNAFLGRHTESSGGSRRGGGDGGGAAGSGRQSGTPDELVLGLCLDAILEGKTAANRSGLGLTESNIVLDGGTTIINGSVEMTDRNGAVTAHNFHCEVEERKVANLSMRER